MAWVSSFFSPLAISIKELKTFIEIARGEKKKSLPKPSSIQIKEKKGITKFKLRTSRYLYTMKVDDKERAQKIIASIPPSVKKTKVGGK